VPEYLHHYFSSLEHQPLIIGDFVQGEIMGTTNGPYSIEFPVGSRVKTADRKTLEEFSRTWKYHNKLQPEQIDYHDRVATVEDAGVYHGGDELYRLEGIPGIWHERLLTAYELGETLPPLSGIEGKAFAERHLIKVKVDPVRWTVLWKNPKSEEYWKEYFPESELPGGGPPEFVKLTEQEAREEFGSW
jgi:hypothetical protein